MIDPATLKIRYPAFAGVSDATIQYWLTDAARLVTDAWGADQESGTLALAAHSMSINRTPGIADGGASQLPAGVTRFRSASVDIGITEAAANATVSGGYGSTSYGAEFAIMLRRNSGGPMLVGCIEPRGWCDAW